MAVLITGGAGFVGLNAVEQLLARGDEVVLRRIPANLTAAFDLLAGLPEDFMAEGRDDTLPQVREGL